MAIIFQALDESRAEVRKLETWFVGSEAQRCAEVARVAELEEQVRNAKTIVSTAMRVPIVGEVG